MVGTRWGPSHLLFLHKPLADYLVDRGFDEAGRNGLAMPVAIRIVRDRRQVSGHVTHELLKFILHGLRMFGISTDLPRQILKGLQCSMWATVPEIGFRTAQDSKTLLYMFGRVRFIRRISWQTLDGL